MMEKGTFYGHDGLCITSKTGRSENRCRPSQVAQIICVPLTLAYGKINISLKNYYPDSSLCGPEHRLYELIRTESQNALPLPTLSCFTTNCHADHSA
jgi:hypothetical protein